MKTQQEAPLRVEPCPCGHPHCRKALIQPGIVAVQGAIDREDAEKVVARVNGWDALIEQRDGLAEVLRNLTTICVSVPIFQLDGGKSSLKAVHMAVKFMGALDSARAALAEVRP